MLDSIVMLCKLGGHDLIHLQLGSMLNEDCKVLNKHLGHFLHFEGEEVFDSLINEIGIVG